MSSSSERLMQAVSEAHEFGAYVSGANRYYSRVMPEVLALPSVSGPSTNADTDNISEQKSLQNAYQNIDHYTEISSVKESSESHQTTWPNDVGMDSMPLHSPPPVPVWPNSSVFQGSVNSSVITSVSSSQPMKQVTSEENVKSPVKMFDAKFIAELEKHLGQKEASANTNPPNGNVRSSSTNVCSNFPAGKVATPTNTGSASRSKQNGAPGTSVIPALKPPPQSNKVLQKNSSLTTSSKCSLSNILLCYAVRHCLSVPMTGRMAFYY